MKVIGIVQQKGGCLKTTIASHLASVLALEGHKVCIIDTDSQSNVAVSFNINADMLKYSLYDALTDIVTIEEIIINVFERGTGRIDIVPSTNNLMMFNENVVKKDRFMVLKDKLSALENEYNYVIIDTPPTLGLMMGNVLACADEVIIPFHPEQYSRRSLDNILNTIDDFKKEINPKLTVMGIIPTIVDVKTNLHNDIIKATRELCDKRQVKMIETVIPKSIQYASSIGYAGRPLILDKPNTKMSRIYNQIWGELNE